MTLPKLVSFLCPAMTLAFALQGAPAMAQAEPPAPAYPKVNVGGSIFADYAVPLNGGPQAFHVTRAFVTATGHLNATWSGLVQLNAYPLAYTNAAGARANEPQNVVLQMAYIQADNLIPGTTMQLGQLFVPWAESVYAHFPYRMLASLPIEGGLQNTLGLGGFNPISAWDRGLKVKGGFGPLAYNVAVFNGEGLRGSEGDGQRSYEGVFTYQPFPFLDVAVLGRKGNLTGMVQADRWGASVVYHTPLLRLGVESDAMVDVNGAGGATFRQIQSAFGVLELPHWLGAPTQLITRQTRLDAEGLANGAQWESLVGLGVQPVKGLTFVLDDQLVHNMAGALTADANVLALHSNFTF
jgi:hypothetical protein